MDVEYRGAKGRLLFKALAWVAITFGLFLLLEGGASFVIFLRELQTKGGVLRPGEIKERSHAVFDAELGWVNKPNVRFDDFYGLGKHLLINSQGFRNEEDFTPDVPLGMQRVICSGDSYTLGFGVANQDTWCAQLEVLFPHLQAVNMGQGGYGVDQAYLWYLRDGLALEQDGQIFAFIAADFQRMTTRRFLGYSKPLLVLEEGQLHTIPPSSRNGFLQRWIPRNGQYFWKLRSVELLARAVGKPRSGVGQPESWTARTWEIVKVLFDDLAERHKQRGSELVLVLLPSRSSPFDATEAYWRLRIEEYARRSGVCFIDLVKEVAALTRDEASSLFNEPPLGHFSEDGNLWVARRLAMRLRSVLSGGEEPDDVGRGHADSCGSQGAKTASRARR